MRRGLPGTLVVVVAVLLAGCGSSSSTASDTHVVRGDGSASTLAHRLSRAGLPCWDYKEVPQVASHVRTDGIRDVGNCSVGHLGVFTDPGQRAKWVSMQMGFAKMAGCAEGPTWAVCVFPNSASKAAVQSALNGVKFG